MNPSNLSKELEQQLNEAIPWVLLGDHHGAEAFKRIKGLLAQEYSRGATKELDWVLAATNNPEDPCYAPKIAREVADRLAELEKGQEETKLKEPSND